MTVSAWMAELLRDLVERDRCLDSGVSAAPPATEPTLLRRSALGVELAALASAGDATRIEPERECDGLREVRCLSVSRG